MLLEDLLEIGDVLLGLLLVRGERAGELGVRCLLRELREGRRERLLRVVHVLQLVDEELLGGGDLRHRSSLLWGLT